ncbi:uncharacterized protein MONOS_13541 [Monocercomonoides exilis]|uniref:uncharacterized protein n=1 Tax=Monocercomonoides exilis TaxID=2049356 RepID=UPI003559E604|nr:hypothetical protein MONOS_13541 [Monocercomonoides exilis]|eukprot:MONOS_13541.1-p1 / transcript=MONOS_13541.1 / gene=MONOS_13541 / organism=Monocercomonoides_exilis_PA203 / gene_product=unspecified product / transcript_product=unspecified product / location=Mono_scaffold00842:9384-11591(+) / protein_length=736 / sequence_SO=supercontig / SO=protein_coding / is_pseudo=false
MNCILSMEIALVGLDKTADKCTQIIEEREVGFEDYEAWEESEGWDEEFDKLFSEAYDGTSREIEDGEAVQSSNTVYGVHGVIDEDDLFLPMTEKLISKEKVNVGHAESRKGQQKANRKESGANEGEKGKGILGSVFGLGEAAKEDEPKLLVTKVSAESVARASASADEKLHRTSNVQPPRKRFRLGFLGGGMKEEKAEHSANATQGLSAEQTDRSLLANSNALHDSQNRMKMSRSETTSPSSSGQRESSSMASSPMQEPLLSSKQNTETKAETALSSGETSLEADISRIDLPSSDFPYSSLLSEQIVLKREGASSPITVSLADIAMIGGCGESEMEDFAEGKGDGSEESDKTYDNLKRESGIYEWHIDDTAEDRKESKQQTKTGIEEEEDERGEGKRKESRIYEAERREEERWETGIGKKISIGRDEIFEIGDASEEEDQDLFEAQKMKRRGSVTNRTDEEKEHILQRRYIEDSGQEDNNNILKKKDERKEITKDVLRQEKARGKWKENLRIKEKKSLILDDDDDEGDEDGKEKRLALGKGFEKRGFSEKSARINCVEKRKSERKGGGNADEELNDEPKGEEKEQSEARPSGDSSDASSMVSSLKTTTKHEHRHHRRHHDFTHGHCDNRFLRRDKNSSLSKLIEEWDSQHAMNNDHSHHRHHRHGHRSHHISRSESWRSESGKEQEAYDNRGAGFCKEEAGKSLRIAVSSVKDAELSKAGLGKQVKWLLKEAKIK